MLNASAFRQKLISWLKQQKPFVLLDSNNYYTDKDLSARPYYHSFDMLAGAGAKTILKANAGNAFKQLTKFREQNKSWLFGYFGYDLKNETEELTSENSDNIELPDMYFFVPEVVFTLKNDVLEIWAGTVAEAENYYSEVIKTEEKPHIRHAEKMLNDVQMQPRLTKAGYINKVEAIKNHIVEGDVYELNFCQEFYAENAELDAFTLYNNVQQISPQPFSAFLHLEDVFAVCASMERFLKKEGNKLISQPIKGTIRRGRNPEEDEQLKIQLQNDEKERAENVMIVDLVRNDLARTAIPGSVKVEELCGIYPFPFVHQMISTVVGEINPSPAIPQEERAEEKPHLNPPQNFEVAEDNSSELSYKGVVKNALNNPTQPPPRGGAGVPEVRDGKNFTTLQPYNLTTCIKNAFPMGSMTGAPKIMAMHLIEKYERSKRGLYSGAIGYFTPDDDFDFNVVIRTFIYNTSKKYLSLHVGSAITYDSDAEREYEECLVKIKGLLRALDG